jgi:hypothetical protein
MKRAALDAAGIVLIALLVLVAFSGAAPIPAPNAPPALILVYLAAPAKVSGWLAPECPSGPYAMRRFASRAELDAFVADAKPMVFGVLMENGRWTGWGRCGEKPNDQQKESR